jgi:hypothetical protein
MHMEAMTFNEKALVCRLEFSLVLAARQCDSQAVFKEIRDSSREAVILYNLGLSAHKLDRKEDAIRYMTEAGPNLKAASEWLAQHAAAPPSQSPSAASTATQDEETNATGAAADGRAPGSDESQSQSYHPAATTASRSHAMVTTQLTSVALLDSMARLIAEEDALRAAEKTAKPQLVSPDRAAMSPTSTADDRPEGSASAPQPSDSDFIQTPADENGLPLTRERGLDSGLGPSSAAASARSPQTFATPMLEFGYENLWCVYLLHTAA